MYKLYLLVYPLLGNIAYFMETIDEDIMYIYLQKYNNVCKWLYGAADAL